MASIPGDGAGRRLFGRAGPRCYARAHMGCKTHVMVATLATALCLSGSAAAEQDAGYLGGSLALAGLGVGTTAIGLGLLAASAGELADAEEKSDSLYATGQRGCFGDARCDEINEHLVDSDNYFNVGLGLTLGGAGVVAMAVVLFAKGAAEGKLASVEITPVITAEGAYASATFAW
jgi:hypothetical protein